MSEVGAQRAADHLRAQFTAWREMTSVRGAWIDAARRAGLTWDQVAAASGLSDKGARLVWESWRSGGGK